MDGRVGVWGDGGWMLATSMTILIRKQGSQKKLINNWLDSQAITGFFLPAELGRDHVY